jgi:phosphoribosylformylglycinamidine synthase
LSDKALMFSESAGRFVVSVHPDNAPKFEYAMAGAVCRKAGRVRGDSRFIIRKGDDMLVNIPIEKVKEAYQRGI